MKLEGIYVPLVTPFDKDGKIDQPKLETLVEAMVDKGVAGLAACGTTGEYYALDDAERSQVLKTVHRVAAGRIEVIAGSGDLCTYRSGERAVEVKAIGHCAVPLSPPT